MNPSPAAESRVSIFFSPLLLLFPLFPLFPVKRLAEKKYVVDGCFLLRVYVNVPLGIFSV